MTVAWLAGAVVIFFASFVMGLTGFGLAIVAMAFLPWLMSPITAVVLLTLYASVFLSFLVIQLRRETSLPSIGDLLVGTLAGIPLGVWGLKSRGQRLTGVPIRSPTMPASALGPFGGT
jgi:uncharacterized protein